MPRYCSWLARAQPSGESSLTPRTVPPQASTDWTAATERALPYPLPDGISARRHAGVLATASRIPAGAAASSLSAVFLALGAGADPQSAGSPGGAMPAANRTSSAALSVNWKSAPSGPATSWAKNAPGRRPVTRRITSPRRNPWVSEW